MVFICDTCPHIVILPCSRSRAASAFPPTAMHCWCGKASAPGLAGGHSRDKNFTDRPCVRSSQLIELSLGNSFEKNIKDQTESVRLVDRYTTFE